MDLTNVRDFVRMGDDAVKILEGLGYRYESRVSGGRKVWVKSPKAEPFETIINAVQKMMDDAQAPLIAKLAEMTAEHTPPMKTGDKFDVYRHAIPSGHALMRHNTYGMIFTARCVERASEGEYEGEWIVRFGLPTGSNNRGFWLPVRVVNKR